MSLLSLSASPVNIMWHMVFIMILFNHVRISMHFVAEPFHKSLQLVLLRLCIIAKTFHKSLQLCLFRFHIVAKSFHKTLQLVFY